MRAIWFIWWREFCGYFATPVAVVFIVIFLAMQGALTFNVGGFFDRDQADLVPFFTYLPWVLLFLIPALTMRQWAEERRQGSIELLLTLPVSPWQAVLGKFLAAWSFCKLAIVLNFPFWITVNYLGHPDNGAIFAGYVGSVLLAGVFLSVGAALSACTKNQVIAFVLAVSVCFLLLAAGTPTVTEFLARARPDVAQAVRLASVADRYADFTRGVIALRDVVFMISLMIFFLFLATLVVDEKRAD